MLASERFRTHLLATFALISTCPTPGLAETNPDATRTPTEQAVGSHDGQHDFDFEFGNWKVQLKRLLHPLAGSNSWVELDGTSIVRKVWDGRANLGELDVTNGDGHIEGLSLRLYNPQTHE